MNTHGHANELICPKLAGFNAEGAEVFAEEAEVSYFRLLQNFSIRSHPFCRFTMLVA